MEVEEEVDWEEGDGCLGYDVYYRVAGPEGELCSSLERLRIDAAQ